MKLCGCVVWYNPTEQDKDNIHNYLDDLEKLYIIDNSERATNIDIKNKIEYISLKKNEGIAKALNIGCKKAFEDGFEWILTMDQDSTFYSSLKKYKMDVLKIQKIDSKIAIFGCSIKEKEKEGYTKKIITSGNILRLEHWEKINGFNEELFIDEVDFEFCVRIILNDLKIYKLSNIFLNHKLGDSFTKKILFFNVTCMNHNKIRKYYIMRNRLFMLRKYPKFCKVYVLSIFLEIFNIIFFEEDKLNKIKFSYRGFKDYLNNKMGKLEC